MIDVTIGSSKNKPCINFPKTMIANDGTVILFHKPECGIVLSATESWNAIGEYSKTWNMSSFKDFNKLITLQNK